MNSAVRNKLSVMMFLEFFIWGAWLPLIFGYLPDLKFSSLEQSWILNAFALASFTAMFFSTQFADRTFAAEKFLAFSHLIGGLAILGLFWVRDFWPFFTLMLVHSLFYVPTISITNSIAFSNLKDAQRDFGLVRLWGTIGWIAASWPFVFILVDWEAVQRAAPAGAIAWLGEVLGTPLEGEARMRGVSYTFVVAGIASLLLAAFSLVLPHTPPKPAKSGGESLAWLEAMKLLRVPFLLILFIVTFFDAAVHQCFFIWTDTFLRSVGIPSNWVMPVMSIGQIAEIGTMAVLGWVLHRLGWKTTMIIGILGHTVRFGIFAFAPEASLVVLINIVHGICYAFFFATVYIFVDEFFPKDARASAQGLFNFLILGVAPFVGNFVWPMIGNFAIEPVAFDRASPASLSVPAASRHVMLAGKAPADAKITITFVGEGAGAKADQKPIRADAKADPSGSWNLAQQYIGGIAGDRVRVQADAAGEITEVKQFNYRKLFLAPAGTALFASLLMLLFFHPPRRAEKALADVPEPSPDPHLGIAPGDVATGIHDRSRQHGVKH